MREPTSLEIVESGYYDELARDPSSDRLCDLGMVHLRMRHLEKALPELWAAMHGRSGLENLGILASGVFLVTNNPLNDPLVLEQIAADTADRKQRAA